MRKCPYCAEEVRADTTVCKHCTRDISGSVGVFNAAMPTGHLLPISVILIGFFGMLIGAQPGAPRIMMLPAWLIAWLGLAMVLKGHGGVVRVGGGFVLSLALMALSISCG